MSDINLLHFTWDEFCNEHNMYTISLYGFNTLLAIKFGINVNIPVASIHNHFVFVFTIATAWTIQMKWDPLYEETNIHQMSIAFHNSSMRIGHFMCMIIMFYCNSRIYLYLSVCFMYACWHRSNADFKWSQIGVIAIKTIERCLLCKLHIDM